MSRAYTLDEIDQMRGAIWRKHYLGCGTTDQTELARWKSIVEDELRTCMLGSISPDELELKYPLPEWANGIGLAQPG